MFLFITSFLFTVIDDLREFRDDGSFSEFFSLFASFFSRLASLGERGRSTRVNVYPLEGFSSPLDFCSCCLYVYVYIVPKHSHDNSNNNNDKKRRSMTRAELRDFSTLRAEKKIIPSRKWKCRLIRFSLYFFEKSSHKSRRLKKNFITFSIILIIFCFFSRHEGRCQEKTAKAVGRPRTKWLNSKTFGRRSKTAMVKFCY